MSFLRALNLSNGLFVDLNALHYSVSIGTVCHVSVYELRYPLCNGCHGASQRHRGKGRETGWTVVVGTH